MKKLLIGLLLFVGLAANAQLLPTTYMKDLINLSTTAAAARSRLGAIASTNGLSRNLTNTGVWTYQNDSGQSLYLNADGSTFEISTSDEVGVDKSKITISTGGNIQITDDLGNAFIINDGLDPIIDTGFGDDGIVEVLGGLKTTGPVIVGTSGLTNPVPCYVTSFFNQSFNPAQASIYWVGMAIVAPTTSIEFTNVAKIIPQSGIIKKFSITAWNQTAVGTAGQYVTNSIEVRTPTTTNTFGATPLEMGTVTPRVLNTNIHQVVNTGDLIAIKVQAPTVWTTPPTAVRFQFEVEIETR